MIVTASFSSLLRDSRLARSLHAQGAIEAALPRLEAHFPDGVPEIALAAAAAVPRGSEAFTDALRGLEAQGVIEAATGGWRRKVR